MISAAFRRRESGHKRARPFARLAFRQSRGTEETKEIRIFVDLTGASGTTYRFAAPPQAGQPARAGNFAVMDVGSGARKVLMLGGTDDLSKVPALVAKAGLGAKAVFVRLNVSRQKRDQELGDLVAQHRPSAVHAG